MNPVAVVEPLAQVWEPVSEGVTRTSLRAEPGEKRVLINIAAGCTYPHHAHATPDEVFVVAGTYSDPGVENGRCLRPARTSATHPAPRQQPERFGWLHHLGLERWQIRLAG
jgi:anti-sigma factor ChrR (cupin superfamily)